MRSVAFIAWSNFSLNLLLIIFLLLKKWNFNISCLPRPLQTINNFVVSFRIKKINYFVPFFGNFRKSKNSISCLFGMCCVVQVSETMQRIQFYMPKRESTRFVSLCPCVFVLLVDECVCMGVRVRLCVCVSVCFVVHKMISNTLWLMEFSNESENNMAQKSAERRNMFASVRTSVRCVSKR